MRIKEAAIRLSDGRVFTGRRHNDAFKAAHSVEPDRMRVIRAEQGFITECGAFLDRYDAAKVAIEAGQIQVMPPGNYLFSEDLY